MITIADWSDPLTFVSHLPRHPMIPQLQAIDSFAASSSLTAHVTDRRNLPQDWPNSGEIDLAIHDLPHGSSTIEWWYVNSHITTIEAREFSVFASFFRLLIGQDETTQAPIYAHSITWAIADVTEQQYYMDSVLDQSTPRIGLQILDIGEDITDPFFNRAIREVFEKGNVPLPDRILQREAKVSLEILDLDFDDNCLVKLADGSYQLTLTHAELPIGCELNFTPDTGIIRHGNDGVVRGNAGEDMFYYFIPKCKVEGALHIHGESHSVAQATGWYDHEFGKPQAKEVTGHIKHDIAWNWISAQLDNGYQVSAYDLFDNRNQGSSAGRWVIVIDPNGQAHNYSDFTFEALENWTSTRTFNTYPTQWQLNIPEADLALFVEAEFPDQEFITIISKPAFWEGRVRVIGNHHGQSVSGLGFVERSGFKQVETLESFLKSVGKETRKAVQALLPLHPTESDLYRLIASEENAHHLDGLDATQYVSNVIAPIRDIIDRGGKAWRSYAALACIDLVGGRSQPFIQWLAWPELLHVGSLIVDDVQDRSDIRRGGTSCHAAYGEPIAINAGNASYFLGQVLLLDTSLTDAEKLQVYELYFETLRAAHAGQAIDIAGFSHLMPDIVKQGNGELLEQRVLSVHRLKSAVPACSLARLGAILGGGNKAQITALSNFFEALGLAFQIMDDVLNLRGFQNNLKSLGEDITCGKVTIPVAKAMSRLNAADRQTLWQTLASKPTDRETIAQVIDMLESCSAIAACEQQAESIVESAWQVLDQIFPDSAVKVRLRAFSWYVLARHY
jgi:geranylgeranyl pyrophosphate synthase/predicted secreted hydrolase